MRIVPVLWKMLSTSIQLRIRPATIEEGFLRSTRNANELQGIIPNSYGTTTGCSVTLTAWAREHHSHEGLGLLGTARDCCGLLGATDCQDIPTLLAATGCESPETAYKAVQAQLSDCFRSDAPAPVVRLKAIAAGTSPQVAC